MPKRKRKKKEVRPEEEEALAESEGLSSTIEEPLVEVEISKDIPPTPIGKVIVSAPYIEPYKRIRYLGVSDVYKIRGPVTGVQYAFTAQDRVSFVATEDYEALLQRVRPARKCCGGKSIPEQPYFGPAE